jgi:NAD(P)-dependent dehydrogenase (short-subunit alcohol dehydrogenase family)
MHALANKVALVTGASSGSGRAAAQLFLAAQYQVPPTLKRKGGSLVFSSAFVGYTAGMPNMAAYAAGKSGLVGLTQALAAELGTSNVRVNALLVDGGVSTSRS